MTNMKKQFSALFTALVLLMLAVFPQSSITANAAEAESISAESVSAKETYHMKIWLSTTPMGSELTSLDQLYPNFPVYLCCKVTNSSDQIVVNGLEYSVDLTVTNPDGTLLQSTTYDTAHSYSSDGKDYYAGYNWIHPILKDLGKYQYKAVMKVDGTDFMTCKVNFTVKQFNVRLDSWVSLSEYGDKTGDKLAPLPKGVTSYICYRLIDKDTEQIAEALSGYTVERKIYLPDGTLFDSDTNESKAQSYNSPKLSTPGKWKVEYTLSGTLKLSYTDYFYVDPAYPVVDKTTESVGADKFTWGEDNWQFSNTTDAFTTGYDVRNDVMYDLLEMTALPNIDREIMLRLPALQADDDWNGSCYGMTMIEALTKQKMLDPAADAGLDPVIYQNTNTEHTLSVINFFYHLQNTPLTQQIFRNTKNVNAKTSQKEFVDKLAEAVSDSSTYINLCYQTVTKDSSGEQVSSGGHSVLAYGREKGAYYVNGKQYDGRILIADPNYLAKNKLSDECCLYYRSDDGSWIVPYQNKTLAEEKTKYCQWNAEDGEDTPNGYLKNILVHGSMIQPVDLINGTENPENYYSRLRLFNCTYANPMVYTRYGNETVIPPEPYYQANGDVTPYSTGYWLKVYDKQACYELFNGKTSGASEPGDFDCYMDYVHYAYFMKMQNTSNVYFHPLGYIEMKGSDMTYDVAIVSNEGSCTTDWYSVSVAGDGMKHLSFRQHEQGYLLTGDNLADVTVSAHNNTAAASVTFSTEYDSALIYEIDELTIGVKVDTDGDDDYETVITAINNLLGDADSDGVLTMQDAVLLYRFLAEDETLKPAVVRNITESEKTDMDADGLVTILDMSLLLEMLASGISA